MKLNICKSALVLISGLVAFASCKPVDTPPEVVSPVFPKEVIKKNVAAAETVSISFDANLDWELSIPSADQNRFWLDDAGIPASSVSGKAGKQTVDVVFSNDEYYDNNVVCKVTLKMGGESKVIAELTRLALNRTLEVYTAQIGDWDFQDTFNAEKATTVGLVTFAGSTEYRMPIKVIANYDWNLVLPAWCVGSVKVSEGQVAPETLSGKAGETVEIMLSAKLSKELKDGAQAEIKFIDAVANDKSMNLPLTLPAFADRFEWSEPMGLDFDKEGVSAHPAVAYLLAMDGFVVRALEWKGNSHDVSFAEWVTVQYGDPDSGSVEEQILRNVAITFGTSVNSGDARSADIFVFPASLAEITPAEICDKSNECAVKEQYKKYCVGRLTQAGQPKPYVKMAAVPEPYEASISTYTESQWWASSAGNVDVINQYELVYSNEWAECVLEFDQPFASYKIFDYDFNEVLEEAQNGFWLAFSGFAENAKGRVTMTPSAFTNEYAPAPESFIVFYDAAGKALAGICCKYSETGGSSVVEAVLSAVAGNPELSIVDESSELYIRLSSDLNVTEVYSVFTAGSTIVLDYTLPITSIGVYDSKINPTNAVSVELLSQNMFVINAPAANNTEAIIVLKDENMVNLAAIHYFCAW